MIGLPGPARRSSRLGLLRAGMALALLLALSALLPSLVRASPRRGEALAAQAIFGDSAAGGGSPSGGTAGASRQRKRPNPAFAGYLSTRTGTAIVQTRFTVPDFACTRREQAISPGVFVLSGPPDHEYFNAANIILGCYRGRRITEEALVVNNIEKNRLRPLHTGDVIIVRIRDRPSGSLTVEVRDLTRGHRFDVKLTGRGVTAQAELLGDWASVDNSTGKEVIPPRFAPTTFSSARIDRRPLGSSRHSVFNMANSRHQLQISTSRLSGTPPETFTCTRVRVGHHRPS